MSGELSYNFSGIEGAVPASGSLDPEYKYVPVRRTSTTEEGDLAAVDGSGTQAAFDAFLTIDGIQGEVEDAATQASLGGTVVRDRGDTIVDFPPGDGSTAAGAAGGGGAGKVHFSDFPGMKGPPPAEVDAFAAADTAAAPPGTGKTLAASLLAPATDAGQVGVRVAASDLAAEGNDPVALDHAVTVLAWARTDGVSPLDAPAGFVEDGLSRILEGAGAGGDAIDDLVFAADTIDAAAFATSMDFYGGIAVQVGASDSGTPEGESQPWPYMV